MKKSVVAGKAINEEDIPPEVIIRSGGGDRSLLVDPPSAFSPAVTPEDPAPVIRPPAVQPSPGHTDNSSASRGSSRQASAGSSSSSRGTSVPHSIAFPSPRDKVHLIILPLCLIVTHRLLLLLLLLKNISNARPGEGD